MDMFCIVFKDFPKDPLYFGFNSAGQDSPLLCNFEFLEPFRHQMDPIFLEELFFMKIHETRRRSQQCGTFFHEDETEVGHTAQHPGGVAPSLPPGPFASLFGSKIAS
jgi:hypothetical protein